MNKHTDREWEEIAIRNMRDDLRKREAAPELYEALELLHDNIDEYQRINNLGGHDNHDMKMARAALSKANGGKQ